MTAPASPTPCCGSCRHWDQDMDQPPGNVGDCRRHPPRIVGELLSRGTWVVDMSEALDFATRFPVTGLGEWCGEYTLRAD